MLQPPGLRRSIIRAFCAWGTAGFVKRLRAALDDEGLQSTRLVLWDKGPPASSDPFWAAVDADAAFDNAFAATVAMAEADAERTWAHDKKRAAKMIAKLGITWRSLFRIYKKHGANRGKAQRGLSRLEASGVAALETYLPGSQRLSASWSSASFCESPGVCAARGGPPLSSEKVATRCSAKRFCSQRR